MPINTEEEKLYKHNITNYTTLNFATSSFKKFVTCFSQNLKKNIYVNK